jgi:DNA-directed RNA polymerase subunit RPC12/RpoP
MSQELPKFTKMNESFECTHCSHSVPIAQKTCRDHCPRCLWSLHVDVNPGDRASGCRGLLKPVSYSSHPKKGWMIHYECQTCGMHRVNRFLESDSLEADSMESLLKLSGATRS